MNFSVGSFLAYWINYACSKNSERLGNWDWRMTLIFQLLAPMIIIPTIWFCPRKPSLVHQEGLHRGRREGTSAHPRRQ
jgi:hypothetical protein